MPRRNPVEYLDLAREAELAAEQVGDEVVRGCWLTIAAEYRKIAQERFKQTQEMEMLSRLRGASYGGLSKFCRQTGGQNIGSRLPADAPHAGPCGGQLHSFKRLRDYRSVSCAARNPLLGSSCARRTLL